MNIEKINELFKSSKLLFFNFNNWNADVILLLFLTLVSIVLFEIIWKYEDKEAWSIVFKCITSEYFVFEYRPSKIKNKVEFVDFIKLVASIMPRKTGNVVFKLFLINKWMKIIIN